MIIRLLRRSASLTTAPKTPKSPRVVEPPAPHPRHCRRLTQQSSNPSQRLNSQMSLAATTAAAAARIQSFVVVRSRQSTAPTGFSGELPIKPTSTSATRIGRFNTLAMPLRAPRGYACLNDCDDPPSAHQSLLLHTDFSTESASSSVTSATALEFWNPSEDAPENPSMENQRFQVPADQGPDHAPDHAPPRKITACRAAPASTSPGPFVAEDRPHSTPARNLAISEPGTILEHIRPHGGKSIDRSVLSKAFHDEPQPTGLRTEQKLSSRVIVDRPHKRPVRNLTNHGHPVADKTHDLRLPSNALQDKPQRPKLPVAPACSSSIRVQLRDDGRGPVDLDLPTNEIDVDSDSGGDDDDDAWSGEFFVNEREDGELYRGLMGYVKGFEPRTIYRLQAQSERSRDASFVVRNRPQCEANGCPPQAAKGTRQRRVTFELPSNSVR